MNQLDDYELGDQAPVSATEDGDRSTGESHESPPGGGDRRRLILTVSALALVALVAIAWWFWGRTTAPSPPPVAVEKTQEGGQAQTRTQLESTSTDEPALPALDLSDALVRELAATLSAHPQFASWLVNEDLVRRLVVTVVNVAEGESPKPHLAFLAPPKAFRAMESDGRLTIDPASYRRFDSIIEVVTSLDTRGSVELYRRVKPLIDDAYRELGYPQGDFDDKLTSAAEAILQTPSAGRGVELEPGVRSYRFADSRFERLDPVQKQLLRLGPSNLEKLQSKIRSFLTELDRAPGLGAD